MIMTSVILTIITRTHVRTQSLLNCIASVDRMQCRQQVEHLLLVDTESSGIDQAQMFIRSVDNTGMYVLVLDDDDEIVDLNLVPKLIRLIHNGYPDAVFTRMDHSSVGLGILPSERLDGQWRPSRGRIGVSAAIVSYQIFLTAKDAFKPQYDGDFDYLDAVYKLSSRRAFLDQITTRTAK